jgi:hypothetical protein
MFALRAGPPQVVTFGAKRKNRQLAPAHAAGVMKTISGHTLLGYPHKRIVGFSIIHLGSWRFFVRLDRFQKICTLAARYPS